MLLFSVLAGLFLMHGLSAGGVGGCHGLASEMVMAHPAMAPAAAGHASAAVEVRGPQPISDHPQVGESCVPLRPEGLSGLFLALFLIVITPWLPGLPRSAGQTRPHWPHGPPRSGAQILRTLNISRT
ncbi:hypothetical protein KGQ20_27195 [Catenulispora sp. NF23]|uniref:hypothetical protein n=1 Tax=Catenulispora pinistramenti TaxID=2705254 RepID=UPI001BA7E879|nr:hypothetical protein [Catenulispora pinistramenti]MBS2536452.1 hypothetical protein [Catenulispora pinistramenti]